MEDNLVKKYTGIHKMSDNKFLNLFKLDALTDAGRKFDYYFVSRRKEKELKIYTKDSLAEGVVIYPILKEDQDKIVMIRQYRYPLDDYLYELPAGLIDEGETPEEAAILKTAAAAYPAEGALRQSGAASAWACTY